MHAQQSRLTTNELFFRQYPDLHFNKDFGGVRYLCKDFPKLIDILLRDIPEWERERYPKHIENDKAFRQITADIERIPATKDAYYRYDLPSIKNRILRLADLEKKFYATTHLIDRFYSTQDSIILADLLIFLSDLPKSDKKGLKASDQGEFLRNIGSYFASFYDLHLSLEFYTVARSIFETIGDYNRLGSIEQDIARLYSQRNIFSYDKRSVLHSKAAVGYYRLAHNTIDSINAQLEVAKRLLWTVEKPTLTDLIFEARQSGQMFNSIDIVQKMKDERDRNYIIDVTYSAIQNLPAHNLTGDYVHNLSLSLGNYFAAIEDWETAEKYLNLALIESFLNSLVNWYMPLTH